ncbi:uncharacterized protein LOC143361331 isoform X2 [Halictus rubicundus]|uniref:uncharacterized protein LOC143361331 isoform X2 n=1 Tax=Halictus rubicundus TaxID=77578 RepID=UPI004036FBE5
MYIGIDHASWTRQDKIFAMTQFKERSAAAFSHAFVLTIKIVSFLESSDQASKYAVTTCSDQSLHWNNKGLVHSFNNELPEHSNQCDSSQEKVCEQKNDKQLDDNFTLNKMSKNSMNEELVNDKQKLNKDLKAINGKSIRHNNCAISDKYSTLSTVEENRLIPNRLEDANILNIETTENKDYDNKVDEDIIQNDTSEFDNNEVDVTNTDSANLPYQYLIEKEIEDSKNGTTNPKISLLGSKKRKRKVSEKCFTASVDLLTDLSKTEESDSSTKRKRESDNIIPRSSDITDLVMEGLMFTIRQGQGTVAVIEQKTKLELDEVLENSEKLETVNGEKCLRNSSLLGLENLITMIESPEKTEAKQKPQNIVMQENTRQYQNKRKCMFNNANYFFENTYFNNICSNKNNTNKKHNTEIYEEGIKLTENESLQYEEENEEKEEEDIIPEALQDSLFEPSCLSFEEVDQFEEAVVNKDLLMDDINTEISTKFGVTFSQDPLLGKKHKLQHEGVIDETKKSNVPIIISNEIITKNQIPLPIQKLLQNKSSSKLASVNGTNETEEKKIDRPQLFEYRNLSNNIHAERQSSDCNILESSQSLANPQTSVSNNNETRNEGASFLILEDEDKNSEVTKNRFEKREDELQQQPVSINKEEQLSSCKLQDVTQDFYQDILYLQTKKNLTTQHLKLRSRKKPVNTLQDANTRHAHIEMIKFFHDITKGAKVVIKRMSTKSIHSIIAKNS